MKRRGEKLDRMELQKLEFLSKAREGFLRQAVDDPDSFVVVDASQSFECVSSQVRSLVQDLLARKA
ncbi:Thymidylate kinase [compost metagenome]